MLEVLDKLSGYKTYLAYIGIVVWVLVYVKVPGVKEAVGTENFGLVLAGLVAAAGISQRAATGKTAQRVEDLHETVTPPKAGSA